MKTSNLIVRVVGNPVTGYTAFIDTLDAYDNSTTVSYLQSFGVKTTAQAKTGHGALHRLAQQMSDAGCLD